MYFLSFETSTQIFSLALSQDDKVLRFRNLKSASVLEDAILPAVDKILDAAGIKFNQIDAFAIALGPGSFTSLRVGLSTIKAFAMSTGKPVVGIPSLDIIAAGVKNMSSPNASIGDPAWDEICVITDARRGKVYSCLYDNQAKRKGEYLLTPIEDVLDNVHGKTIFVGNAVALYRKHIEEAYKDYNSQNKSSCACLFADDKLALPSAKIMANLAYARLKNTQFDNAAQILPLYLYPHDCQVSKPQAK